MHNLRFITIVLFISVLMNISLYGQESILQRLKKLEQELRTTKQELAKVKEENRIMKKQIAQNSAGIAENARKIRLLWQEIFINGKILWRHTSGKISLWSVDSQGNPVGFKEHGPFNDWTPINYSNGKILWRHTSGKIFAMGRK